MPRTLHITKWSEVFEHADSRKRQRLAYFQSPSGCDSAGFLSLVTEFDQSQSLMAFGVFQAICQYSATLGKDVRGSFKNSSGRPMSLKQIALLIRIEKCHLSAAIEILTDSRVGWLYWEDEEDESADDLPPACREIPVLCKEKEKEKESTGAKAPLSFSPKNDEKKSDEIQKRINQIYKRRDSTKWSDKELRAFRKLKITEEDLKLIEAYCHPETGSTYRRRDILTLLNNWNGEVDRARAWTDNPDPNPTQSTKNEVSNFGL